MMKMLNLQPNFAYGGTSNFDGIEKEFPLYLMILMSAKLTKSLPTLIIIFGPVVCT